VWNQPWIAISLCLVHEHDVVNQVLARMREPVGRVLCVSSRQLRGGIEADQVVEVNAMYRDAIERRRQVRFVVKSLAGSARREAEIYTGHLRPHWGMLCPRFLGAEHTTDGRTVLYLEALRRPRGWPWRDAAVVTRVLRSLATFHAANESHHAGVLPEWDYQGVVQAGAIRALESLEQCGHHPDLAPLLKFRPALRRLTDAIGPMRRWLLSRDRLAASPLHGDVHSANVLLRRGPAGDVPVLIDWARARMGSPLEDVSSWLQSLSYWEPEAARRHDTLLSLYLRARSLPSTPTRELRVGYWVAAASNVLAGAVAHHLTTCLTTPVASAERVSAFWRARDALRIVLRADALYR
jgi:hypothetical protein